MSARILFVLFLLLMPTACGRWETEIAAEPLATEEATDTLEPTSIKPTDTIVATETVVPTVTLVPVATASPVAIATRISDELELVNNRSFNTNTSSWDRPYGTLSHTTSEYHTAPGAALVITTDSVDNLDYRGSIGQCVDLSNKLNDWPQTAGHKYLTIEAYLKTDASIMSATLNGIISDDLRCGTGHVGNLVTLPVTGNQEWTRVLATTEIPDAANSIHVYLWVTGMNDSARVYVDDIRVYSTEPENVP